jgi:hypothetical protein
MIREREPYCYEIRKTHNTPVEVKTGREKRKERRQKQRKSTPKYN